MSRSLKKPPKSVLIFCRTLILLIRISSIVKHIVKRSKTKNKTTFIKNVGISFSIIHISMWGFFYGTNGKKM